MGWAGGGSTFVIVAVHLFFLFLRQHFVVGNVGHVKDLAMLYKVYNNNNKDNNNNNDNNHNNRGGEAHLKKQNKTENTFIDVQLSSKTQNTRWNSGPSLPCTPTVSKHGA